jgi:hypothetical protein
MPPSDRDLRIGVYEWIVERGMPPSNRELAASFGVAERDLTRALAALKIGKTVLVHPRTGEIWMAGPFAATESPYKVIGRKNHWFANCAWDMLGVAVIVNEPVRIEARCTDCDEPMTLDVEPRVDFVMVRESKGSSDPDRSMGGAYLGMTTVVHFLVPARRWYDDIGFT